MTEDCDPKEKIEESIEEAIGLRYNPAKKEWVLEETIGRDDDDPRNIAIKAKIAADDLDFLRKIGIKIGHSDK